MTITVIKPGLQTTIQSRPRSGLRHFGVPSSGAADSLSLALANKLVGNAWDAPALEATLLGPTLRFDSELAFALVGAEAAVSLNGVDVVQHRTLFARAGDELTIGPISTGARVYLAVPGGFNANEILGSASTNLQAGFGGYEGRALQADDTLVAAGGTPEVIETPAGFRPPLSGSTVLRCCLSAESELLDAASLEALFENNWSIDRRADRMGLRLDGPALDVASEGRMPSACVMPGTIQCPEDGAPYILSVDAGTVGGYPRIAQVARVDRHMLGQMKPGDHVRLVRRDPDDAIAEFRAKLGYWSEWLPDMAEII